MKPRINKLYKRMKRHKQSKKRIDINYLYRSLENDD